MGYKLRRHGLRFSDWGPERSQDLGGAVQAASEKRRGRLEFPDEGFTKDNWRTLFHWVWVWLQ